MAPATRPTDQHLSHGAVPVEHILLSQLHDWPGLWRIPSQDLAGSPCMVYCHGHACEHVCNHQWLHPGDYTVKCTRPASVQGAHGQCHGECGGLQQSMAVVRGWFQVDEAIPVTAAVRACVQVPVGLHAQKQRHI